MRIAWILLLVTTCIVKNSQAQAAWQDIQRQFPAVTLEQLESANSSVQVLRERHTSSTARGTIVLFPDAQHHAFSPDLLNQLRRSLPAAGWDLLMLPQPETDSAPSAEQRVVLQKSALAARWQLITQQATLQQPVIAIAQGETAALLNLLISDNLSAQPAALVNLGLYLNGPPQQQLLDSLSNQAIPVLDLIIATDHPQAKHGLAERALRAKQQHNALYRQRRLSDAYHDQSMQQWLVQEIIGWLKTTGF